MRLGDAVHYWVLNPGQPGLVGRLNLVDEWWCVIMGVGAEEGAVDPARLVHNLIGDETEPVAIEVLATDPWRARMQVSDTFRSGRVFLAGDAAHQNPPWGGHGFNTGIGDAVNIGWKLGAVLNGWVQRAFGQLRARAPAGRNGDDIGCHQEHVHPRPRVGRPAPDGQRG